MKISTTKTIPADMCSVREETGEHILTARDSLVGTRLQHWGKTFSPPSEFMTSPLTYVSYLILKKKLPLKNLSWQVVVTYVIQSNV